MRIAFVGLPLAALLLRADGHEIVWAGICRRDAIGLRRLRKQLGAKKVFVLPDLVKSAPAIAEAKPDLIVSWFWTKLVPKEVRAIAPAFGVHPSLLPRHRGPDPTFWAIDSGDEETGVTAHMLDDAYDTGALLGHRTLAINPSWNAWTLAKRLDRPSLALLRETARTFKAIKPTQQDNALATEAPSPDDDMLELRWDQPAEAIVRRIRAASPWPGAFTEIAGEVITVTHAAVVKAPKALEPGEAILQDGVAVVKAIDGGVALLRAHLEEDETPIDLTTLIAV